MSANITASGPLDEGSNYTLICAVDGDESLAPTNRTFQWERVDNVDETSQDPAYDALTFNPLHRNDTGEYRCNVSFDSPYLIGTRHVTTSFDITVSKFVQA